MAHSEMGEAAAKVAVQEPRFLHGPLGIVLSVVLVLALFGSAWWLQKHGASMRF